MQHRIMQMYNECEACNTFFLVAKNLFTTHNIYQYINKKQTKKKKDVMEISKTYYPQNEIM